VIDWMWDEGQAFRLTPDFLALGINGW